MELHSLLQFYNAHKCRSINMSSSLTIAGGNSISSVARVAGTDEAPNSVRAFSIHITVVQCGSSTLIDICKERFVPQDCLINSVLACIQCPGRFNVLATNLCSWQLHLQCSPAYRNS